MIDKPEVLTMSGDEFREMCGSSFGSTSLSTTGSPTTMVGRRDSIMSCASNPGLSGSSSSYYESLPSTPSNQEPFTRGYQLSSYQAYNANTPVSRPGRDITQSFSQTPMQPKFANAGHVEDDMSETWFAQKPQIPNFQLPLGEHASFEGPVSRRVPEHDFGNATSRYDFGYSHRNVAGLPSPPSPSSVPDYSDSNATGFYNDSLIRSTDKLRILMSSPLGSVPSSGLQPSPWNAQAGYASGSIATDSFSSDYSDQHYPCQTMLHDHDIDMHQSVYPPDLTGCCDSDLENARPDTAVHTLSPANRREKRRSTRRSKTSAKHAKEVRCERAGGSSYVTAQFREKPKEKCPAQGCTKAFARTEHLTRHIKNVHHNLRPYICALGKPWCKKGADGDSRIGRSDNQKDHYYTHIKLNKKKRNESPGRDFTYWLIRRFEGDRAEKLINQIERKLAKEGAEAGEPNEDLLSKHHLWPEYCQWRGAQRKQRAMI